jgi:hypothetical protein
MSVKEVGTVRRKGWGGKKGKEKKGREKRR